MMSEEVIDRVPIKQMNAYAISKWAGELQCLNHTTMFGVEVVPFDADEFAAAMQRLLTDKERYDRYRANCQETIADSFFTQPVVDRLEAVYKHVIDDRENG